MSSAREVVAGAQGQDHQHVVGAGEVPGRGADGPSPPGAMTSRGSSASVRTSAGGRSIPLDPDAGLRTVGDELEVDASTSIDHRELGMTHSRVGMIRTPTEPTHCPRPAGEGLRLTAVSTP
jgi:hypothetical protein